MNASRYDGIASEASVLVHRQLLDGARVREQLAAAPGNIVAAAQLIAESFRSGGKLLLCGNGGSAADCQHLAAEFLSRLSKEFERPSLPAIALTTDSSFITAFSNDCGFEGVFARQVEGLGRPGDVLLGISTSGNSANVLHAANAAKSTGLKVIGLTGENGGQLAPLCDVAVTVPVQEVARVQELHLPVYHALCQALEDGIFG